jgi:hypothetical protein
MGVSVVSSSIACAARSTRSSSPSAKTMRGLAVARLEDRAHQQRGAEDRPFSFACRPSMSSSGRVATPAFHRGLRHGGGDHAHQPRVEGLRDQVVGPKVSCSPL